MVDTKPTFPFGDHTSFVGFTFGASELANGVVCKSIVWSSRLMRA